MILRKTLMVILLTSFMLVGGLGVFHFGMGMEMDGQMSGCPFMGMTAICQMTPFEHISAWQNMFTSLPWPKDVASLFLILLAFFLGLAWIGKIPIRALSLRSQPILRVRRDYIPVANPFQELFSSGILNPKVI